MSRISVVFRVNDGPYQAGFAEPSCAGLIVYQAPTGGTPVEGAVVVPGGYPTEVAIAPNVLDCNGNPAQAVYDLCTLSILNDILEALNSGSGSSGPVAECIISGSANSMSLVPLTNLDNTVFDGIERFKFDADGILAGTVSETLYRQVFKAAPTAGQIVFDSAIVGDVINGYQQGAAYGRAYAAPTADYAAGPWDVEFLSLPIPDPAGTVAPPLVLGTIPSGSEFVVVEFTGAYYTASNDAAQSKLSYNAYVPSVVKELASRVTLSTCDQTLLTNLTDKIVAKLAEVVAAVAAPDKVGQIKPVNTGAMMVAAGSGATFVEYSMESVSSDDITNESVNAAIDSVTISVLGSPAAQVATDFIELQTADGNVRLYDGQSITLQASRTGTQDYGSLTNLYIIARGNAAASVTWTLSTGETNPRAPYLGE